MALRMRMTTGDGVSSWLCCPSLRWGVSRLTVEDPADEPHGVRCCGFRSRRAIGDLFGGFACVRLFRCVSRECLRTSCRQKETARDGVDGCLVLLLGL